MSSVMLPVCCEKMTLSLEEFPFQFWKKEVDEVVDDLFEAIQNIAAGTATVSKKMLSESCLEWKIEFSPNSPVIFLQYKSNAERKEMPPLIPLMDYPGMDDHCGNAVDTKIRHALTTFEEAENKLSALSKSNQGTPEFSSVLCNNKETINKQLFSFNTIQDNQIDDTSQTNNNSRSTSNYFMKSIEARNALLSSSDSNECNIVSKDLIQNERLPASETLFQCKDGGKSTGHNKCESGKGHFKCKFCKQYFTSSSDLSEHRKLDECKTLFYCEYCSKSFRCISWLVAHERIHTNEKPFKCEQCGKLFMWLGGLTEHKRIHRREKSYKCPLCERSYNTSWGLTYHKRIHTEDKPFLCDRCGKSFKQLSDLNVHKRIHFEKNVLEMQQTFF